MYSRYASYVSKSLAINRSGEEVWETLVRIKCSYLTNKNMQFTLRVDPKVACTAGSFFEKNYEAVPHVFFSNKLPSD